MYLVLANMYLVRCKHVPCALQTRTLCFANMDMLASSGFRRIAQLLSNEWSPMSMSGVCVQECVCVCVCTCVYVYVFMHMCVSIYTLHAHVLVYSKHVYRQQSELETLACKKKMLEATR